MVQLDRNITGTKLEDQVKEVILINQLIKRFGMIVERDINYPHCSRIVSVKPDYMTLNIVKAEVIRQILEKHRNHRVEYLFGNNMGIIQQLYDKVKVDVSVARKDAEGAWRIEIIGAGGNIDYVFYVPAVFFTARQKIVDVFKTRWPQIAERYEYEIPFRDPEEIHKYIDTLEVFVKEIMPQYVKSIPVELIVTRECMDAPGGEEVLLLDMIVDLNEDKFDEFRRTVSEAYMGTM